MKKMLLAAAAAVPMIGFATAAHAEQAGDKIPGAYICVFNKNFVSRGTTPGAASRRSTRAWGR